MLSGAGAGLCTGQCGFDLEGYCMLLQLVLSIKCLFYTVALLCNIQPCSGLSKTKLDCRNIFIVFMSAF